MAKNYSSSSESSDDFQSEDLYQVPKSYKIEDIYQVPKSVQTESLYQIPRSYQRQDSSHKPHMNFRQYSTTTDDDTTDTGEVFKHEIKSIFYEIDDKADDSSEYNIPKHWPPLLAPTNALGQKVERLSLDDSLSDRCNTVKCSPNSFMPITSEGKHLNKDMPKPAPRKSLLSNLSERTRCSISNLYEPDDGFLNTDIGNTPKRLEEAVISKAMSKSNIHITSSSSSSDDESSKQSDASKLNFGSRLKKRIVKSGLGKLSSQAMRLKDLRKSVASVSALDDFTVITSPVQGNTAIKKKHPLRQHMGMPNYMPIINVYFEGVVAVGKTSMLRHVEELLRPEILMFPEPMKYWTEVFDNVLKTLKKANKKKQRLEDTSAVVTACQLKFATPFRLVESKKQMHSRCVDPIVKAAPMHRWLLHDRHIISPTVVFPLCHFKSGLMTGRDFIQLLSTFTCNNTDNIVWLKLKTEENLKRLKKRSRNHEENLNSDYLIVLNECFHAVYCGWLLTQYMRPEDISVVCIGSADMTSVCKHSDSPTVLRTAVAEKLFDNSIFSDIKNIIEPHCTDPFIAQLCLKFTRELAKLQFIVINYGDYVDDHSSCWTEIYTQCLRNQHIKSLVLDWTAISEFLGDIQDQD